MTVDQPKELVVSVDKGMIEDVEWSISGGSAVIEPISNNKTKAVITAIKAGTVTVFARVTAKDGDQTAVTTAKTEVNVKFALKAEITEVPEKMYYDDVDIISVLPDMGNEKNAYIENVEWTVEGDAISIVPDEADKTKAVISAKAIGSSKIFAKITATCAEQTAVYMAETETIDVKPSTVTLDIVNGAWTLTQWGTESATKTNNSDGSVEIQYTKQYREVTLKIPVEYSDYKNADIYYTFENGGGTCNFLDGFGGNMSEVSNNADHHIYKITSDARFGSVKFFNYDEKLKVKINSIKLSVDKKLSLSKLNEISSERSETKYVDGKVKLKLDPQFSGSGVRWSLLSPVDLNEYKIVIYYTASDSYPVLCELKDSETGGTDPIYGDTSSGKWEITSNKISSADELFFKYNTYGSDRTDAAEITINSIEFVKK